MWEACGGPKKALLGLVCGSLRLGIVSWCGGWDVVMLVFTMTILVLESALSIEE